MTAIKGILFDYGATLDTNGIHWGRLLWIKYQEIGIPITEEQFREGYVHGERTLAHMPLIKPEHTFRDLLDIKVPIEMQYLVDRGYWNPTAEGLSIQASKVAELCYCYVLSVLDENRKVLQLCKKKYPLVLVSNFYGNVHAVLTDFRLDSYFNDIIESVVVGVCKPDPAIWQKGVDALGLSASEVLVVGDSFTKDIQSAKSIGCQTAWLKGTGWGNEENDESLPDYVIGKVSELPKILNIV
jgi:FMN phosphatase YigB (HAD superfamily)